MNLVLSCSSLLTEKKLSYWPLSLSRETRQDTDSLHIRSVGFPFLTVTCVQKGKLVNCVQVDPTSLYFISVLLNCLKQTRKCKGPWKAPVNSVRGPEFGFAVVAMVGVVAVFAMAVVAGTLRRRPSRFCSSCWSVENWDWTHCPPSCARPLGGVLRD